MGFHPVTGQLQVVERVETIKEIQRIIEKTEAPPLFQSRADKYLLSLGVPENWLPVVREVRSEDKLFEVIGNLPEDVQERLLSLAAGELPTPPAPVAPNRLVQDSPDLRRRFFVVEREDELQAILEAPLEQWMAFLHPSQRALVEGTYKGPVKVTGAAGTGKTVVGLHRARRLAQQGHQVLFTTFTTTLARNLERSLDLLCVPEVRARITVSTVHKQARDLAQADGKTLETVKDTELRALVKSVLQRAELPEDPDFVGAEWEHVIHAQGIQSWKAYRSARRTGRGTPLSARERKALWPAFEAIRGELASRSQADWPTFCRLAEDAVKAGRVKVPYDAVVVDEIQDLKAPDLAFLASLVGDHGDRLMLLGDAGQRIYPGGFSLTALGLDVRGRSHVLRLNYRTTEEIRRAADRVLGDEVDDLDAGTESRQGTRSLLKGPEPTLRSFEGEADEADGVVDQLRAWIDGGLKPEAIAVFARTGSRATALREAAEAAGLPCRRLAAGAEDGEGIGFGTMHGAKGLEFKAVLVASCARKYLPLPAAVKSEKDPIDRAAATDRERQLLYVAMTRARDELVVTWAKKPSAFLEPLAHLVEPEAAA